MASRRKLGSYLEWQGPTIRVSVPVPKKLQAILGKTRFKESLGTDSPARADALKWRVIAKLKAEMSAAAKVTGDPLVSEAMKWRSELAAADGPQSPDDDDLRGTMDVLLVDRAEEIERSQGLAAATAFVGVARGTATPIKAHLETFLSEKTYSARYKDDIRRAAGRLVSWSARGNAPETLEAISRKVAGHFISKELAKLLGDPKTINKDISALSSYWRWLGKRGHLAEDAVNPWERQGFEVPRSAGLAAEGEERAFTAEEAAALLHGPASARMKDIMWIGALSGMRIDEICRLQVRDCQDGWFAVNARRSQTGEGKTDAARRDVPIHTALAGIVERRCKGKAADALLIDGLPDADPSGKRKPSAAAGQEFTRYRRAVGVDERAPGKRRALVNFHSWRRWFVTEALRANHHKHIVSAVVGHEEGRAGVTLGSYFRDGPSAEQFKAVVESVRVPAMKLSHGPH
jgi:integrase